jgi:hypothetical protein
MAVQRVSVGKWGESLLQSSGGGMKGVMQLLSTATAFLLLLLLLLLQKGAECLASMSAHPLPVCQCDIGFISCSWAHFLKYMISH